MSVCWVIYGYSLAFKGDGMFIGDLSAIFLNGVERDSLSGTLPESVFITFQMTFAIITPALVVGAFAERGNLQQCAFFQLHGLLCISTSMSYGLGRWISWIDRCYRFCWRPGCSCYMWYWSASCSIISGTKKWFYEISMPPHNRTMVMIGASMLWVGWFGFNAGSAVAADGSAGMAMLVTHISAQQVL